MIFNGNSKEKIRTVLGGSETPPTMFLSCDVRPGIQYPFAGTMYVPAAALGRAGPVDLSGASDISFWSRGDGKTYSIAVFRQSTGGTPALRPFVAGKKWDKHTMPFSDFHTDGHDITLVSFVATAPGKYDFELRDVQIGAPRTH